MLTTLLIAGLVIASTLVVALIVIIRRLNKRNEVHEAWIMEFKQEVNDTYALMRAIDDQGKFASRVNDKGVFESDDEVGQVFKQLLDLIQELNERTQ